MRIDQDLLVWLLEGDAAVRWQVRRDLLDAPSADWEAERAKVALEGAGRRLIENQDAEGTWGGGIYSPKWISTTYTLLLLRDLGVDGSCEAARRGAELVVEALRRSKEGPCTCVKGMWLAIGARFWVEDPVLEQTASYVLSQQLADGGWNCRWPRVAKTHHSSFHTTLNVLDGIGEAIRLGIGPVSDLRKAQDSSIELLLQHRLFKSDKTGAVINPAFQEAHFPPRWHYDVLRGMDYIRTTRYAKDERLADAVDLLQSQRRGDGRWPAAKGYGGKVFFPLEDGRGGSRWNTLRALRCLKAYSG